MSNGVAVSPSEAALDEYHESFSDPKADIVLRSRDGTKFRTYALVLRLSSSFFEALLDLPDVSEGEARNATSRGVLQLDEDGAVIANALTMMSGKAFPPEMVSSSCCVFKRPND